jgi:hypothetical protein
LLERLEAHTIRINVLKDKSTTQMTTGLQAQNCRQLEADFMIFVWNLALSFFCFFFTSPLFLPSKRKSQIALLFHVKTRRVTGNKTVGWPFLAWKNFGVTDCYRSYTALHSPDSCDVRLKQQRRR